MPAPFDDFLDAIERNRTRRHPETENPSSFADCIGTLKDQSVPMERFGPYWLLFYRLRHEGVSADEASGVARDLFLGTQEPA